MFKKILIANRGEIACRIIHTLKQLNIIAIAVYSEADRFAKHVKQADEAYCIGESQASQSYLCIDKIIEVAKIAGADAIHPGYGFLSENAVFAKACENAGIIFIGPPVAAIESMGSKAAAKALMAQQGIPLLPGFHEAAQDEKTLLNAAKQIGFPVLIKASFGGGGRGMRVAKDAETFAEALAMAKREALSNFGNDHVILEKYLTNPRHIEVQIFADRYQGVCYLFERDCSIQRRHQKVVEEAPAPRIDEALREKLGKAAMQAARAIGYVGAGTVEFLLGEDQQFYFMEMNTRLQVEHPVTEMITGEDLVEWQIHVAQGLPLPKTQEALKIEGAAIEVRLCAEDPCNNFLPATGKIEAFDYPNTVRVDTGYCAGDTISIYYDSLFAKIIAWGKNREEARRLMLEALDQTEVIGVKTNRALLVNILQQADFINAQTSTHFITMHEHTLLNLPKVAPFEVLVTLGLLHIQKLVQASRASDDPWQKLLAKTFLLEFADEQENYSLRFEKEKEGWHVTGQTKSVNAWFLDDSAHRVDVSLNGETITMKVWESRTEFTVHYQHQYYLVHQLSRFGQQATHTVSESQLTAPMPGRVIARHVNVGDKVNSGQTILVMEAMKMEHAIRAPYDSVVKAIHCKVGEIVSEGVQLVELEE